MSDVKSLDELLFDYGNTAYQEGVEGRSHDTIDGKAEKAFHAIKNRFQELEKQLAGSVPKSEIIKLIKNKSEKGFGHVVQVQFIERLLQEKAK